jgi:hypothetical protein
MGITMNTDQKLDDIIARLERIEARQIKTTAAVLEIEKEVEEEEKQHVGSFATVDPPKHEK